LAARGHDRDRDFGAGLAGGFAARYVGMPLPFILGPLSVVAAGGLAGLPVQAIRRARPVGQFVTGSAVVPSSRRW